MRLSGLSVAPILLLTSSLFGQHTPSAPPPPAPAPSVSSSSSSSTASSASATHYSAPSPSPSSSPSPVSVPASHASASSSSSPPAASHVSVSPSNSSMSSGKAPSPARSPESGSQRVISEEKIDGTEGRIVPAKRIGENPPEKEREAKPADPDLRRRICDNGPCKEPVVKPQPESDLRRRVCVNGTCGCPAGQVAGKGGCVAPAAEARAQQCEVGASWNGASCVYTQTECAGITGQAAALAAELRSIQAEMQAACFNDPSSQECYNANRHLEEARLRYRMLLNGAPSECRRGLADELSLL